MAKGLTNDYLEKITKKIVCNHHFLGVFPCDIHPNINVNKTFSIIFNTGDSTTSGEHFVAIYRNKKSFFYFDSFGLKPNDINIIDFIEKNRQSRHFSWNNKPMQDKLSNFCGFYCLAFIVSKDRNISFNVFKRFINKKQNNDKNVIYFLLKYM